MKIPFLPIHIFTEQQMVDIWKAKGQTDTARTKALLHKNHLLLGTIKDLKAKLARGK
jgi:hypothetical protein